MCMCVSAVNIFLPSDLLIFILTPVSFELSFFFPFVVLQQHKTEVASVKVRHNFPLCKTSPARPKWLLLASQ